MTTPLKVYNSGSALQEMTDAEIDSFIVPLVLKEFAANNAFNVRGNVTAYANNSGNVGGLINRLRDGDNVNAEKAFNTAMAGKMTDALDAKKVELASSMVQRDVKEPEEEIVPGTGMENDEEQELAPAEAEEEQEQL